mmetsp:Transcript_22758/g.71262  ORF Transcript_22758/g.71262 Transcript_22758/m.71262 type:complete len:213 (-) Transcript_22758:313-951(-)
MPLGQGQMGGPAQSPPPRPRSPAPPPQRCRSPPRARSRGLAPAPPPARPPHLLLLARDAARPPPLPSLPRCLCGEQGCRAREGGKQARGVQGLRLPPLHGRRFPRPRPPLPGLVHLLPPRQRGRTRRRQHHRHRPPPWQRACRPRLMPGGDAAQHGPAMLLWGPIRALPRARWCPPPCASPSLHPAKRCPPVEKRRPQRELRAPARMVPLRQ